MLIFVDKKWLDRQYHDEEKTQIKKPDELEDEMEDPPGDIDEELLDRVQGSIIGMALGDALGAHVEFRPYEYVKQNPVTKMEEGGTWGLNAGQVFDLKSIEMKCSICSFLLFSLLMIHQWVFV